MILLQRISLTKYATFGAMIDSLDWLPFAVTVERPWLNNEPFVSCIPEGDYICKRVQRAKHGECFEVQNVEGRSAILFHIANFPSDVQGCIGVATGFGTIRGAPAVVSSANAMERFMERMKGLDKFNLSIREVSP